MLFFFQNDIHTYMVLLSNLIPPNTPQLLTIPSYAYKLSFFVPV